MNYSVIRNILGKLMILVAFLMCFPLIVSLIYQEGLIFYLSYLIPIILLLSIGYICNIKKAKTPKMLAREGIVIVGLSWLIMALAGAIPLMISQEVPNFFDAFFEMASGFTTTGASVITDITEKAHSTIFWRSFSHWIGGMGVLVFILAIIPESKEGSSLHILRAESPGPQVGRLVSKMQASSRILYIIYLVLTLIEFILLLLDPTMDVFNSLIYSLGTAGTGGFSAHADGLASFSTYSQYIIAIFMFIFGINFSLFYLLLIGNFKDILKNDELKVYLIIVILCVTLICINIYPIYENLEQTFRLSFFQVASIISTTGYATADFNLWPGLSKGILFILMFIGACAGSTAGGIKISRIVLLFKRISVNLHHMIHPRGAEAVRFEGKKVENETLNGVLVYFAIYFVCFTVILFVLLFEPFDFETNISAVAACFNNVGPGLSKVGPMGNYDIFSCLSKTVLSFAMLLGRLEIYPLILLFSPRNWIKSRNK